MKSVFLLAGSIFFTALIQLKAGVYADTSLHICSKQSGVVMTNSDGADFVSD